MTRPAASCFCLNRGIWAAIYAEGPGSPARIADFRNAHSGPGHLPEDPPRDWHGKEAALAKRLRELARQRVVRPVNKVDTGGRL